MRISILEAIAGELPSNVGEKTFDRNVMPQLKLPDLQKHDIPFKNIKIDLDKIKPVQNQRVPGLAQKVARDFHSKDKPFILDKDGYLVNGHHRYDAARMLGINNVDAILVGISIEDLINMFPQAVDNTPVDEDNSLAEFQRKLKIALEKRNLFANAGGGAGGGGASGGGASAGAGSGAGAGTGGGAGPGDGSGGGAYGNADGGGGEAGSGSVSSSPAPARGYIGSMPAYSKSKKKKKKKKKSTFKFGKGVYETIEASQDMDALLKAINEAPSDDPFRRNIKKRLLKRNLNPDTKKYVNDNEWKMTSVEIEDLDDEAHNDQFGRIIDVDSEVGVNFSEPIMVHADGKTIIDGFHRVYQAKKGGLNRLPAYIPEGTSIQYTKPNLDVEWKEAERYSELAELGLEGWKALKGQQVNVKQLGGLKNIQNTEGTDVNTAKKAIATLEPEKVQRMQQAIKSGAVELPIIAKFHSGEFDLVAGNTRFTGLVANGILPEVYYIDLTTQLNETATCGDCYEAAGRQLMNRTNIKQHGDELLLVHGMASGQGPIKGQRFGHAWNEIGDVVFDHSNGKNIVLRKEEYYKVGNIDENEVKRYTFSEMAKMVTKHKHWGPWETTSATSVNEFFRDEFDGDRPQKPKRGRLVTKDGDDITDQLPFRTWDFRGDPMVVVDFAAPHKPGSTGRIYTDKGGSYFPGVADLKIIDHDFSESGPNENPKTMKRRAFLKKAGQYASAATNPDALAHLAQIAPTPNIVSAPKAKLSPPSLTAALKLQQAYSKVYQFTDTMDDEALEVMNDMAPEFSDAAYDADWDFEKLVRKVGPEKVKQFLNDLEEVEFELQDTQDEKNDYGYHDAHGQHHDESVLNLSSIIESIIEADYPNPYDSTKPNKEEPGKEVEPTAQDTVKKIKRRDFLKKAGQYASAALNPDTLAHLAQIAPLPEPDIVPAPKADHHYAWSKDGSRWDDSNVWDKESDRWFYSIFGDDNEEDHFINDDFKYEDWMTAFAQCEPGSKECDILLTHEVFSNMLSDGPLDEFDDLYKAYDEGKADENMIRKYQELAKSHLANAHEKYKRARIKNKNIFHAKMREGTFIQQFEPEYSEKKREIANKLRAKLGLDPKPELDWKIDLANKMQRAEWIGQFKDIEKNINKIKKKIKEQESTPTPKYLYHVTFKSNIQNIKAKGLEQFHTSLWVKGPGGKRYNQQAGIFAFDHPLDAITWAQKMEWEFRDDIAPNTNDEVAIIRLDMQDGENIWGDDPSDDPMLARHGKSFRSSYNIKADKIIDAFSMGQFGKAGELKISRDQWLSQVQQKLTEVIKPPIGWMSHFALGKLIGNELGDNAEDYWNSFDLDSDDDLERYEYRHYTDGPGEETHWIGSQAANVMKMAEIDSDVDRVNTFLKKYPKHFHFKISERVPNPHTGEMGPGLYYVDKEVAQTSEDAGLPVWHVEPVEILVNDVNEEYPIYKTLDYMNRPSREERQKAYYKSLVDKRKQRKLKDKKKDKTNERPLTKDEEDDKEKYVKGMKKNKKDFKKRYGKNADAVMYATATKMAKEGDVIDFPGAYQKREYVKINGVDMLKDVWAYMSNDRGEEHGEDTKGRVSHKGLTNFTGNEEPRILLTAYKEELKKFVHDLTMSELDTGVYKKELKDKFNIVMREGKFKELDIERQEYEEFKRNYPPFPNKRSYSNWKGKNGKEIEYVFLNPNNWLHSASVSDQQLKNLGFRLSKNHQWYMTVKKYMGVVNVLR